MILAKFTACQHPKRYPRKRIPWPQDRLWLPPALTEWHCNVPAFMPTVRDSGIDRLISPSARSIVTLQCHSVKAKPLLWQWWLVPLPLVPDLGIGSGLRPFLPAVLPLCPGHSWGKIWSAHSRSRMPPVWSFSLPIWMSHKGRWMRNGQRIISKGYRQQWRSATGHLEPYNGSGGIFERN